MHKRLLSPVLDRLQGERRHFIAEIGDALDADPRIENQANLIFYVLAKAAPFLPLLLPKDEIIGYLLVFVERNRHRLIQTMFDPAVIADGEVALPIVGEFVAEMALRVLKRYDRGDLSEQGGQVYRLKWPFDPADFPYADPDDD